MSRAAAFFDLDRTLVACHTGRLFVADLRRRGEISLAFALRTAGWLARYHLSMLDLNGMVTRATDFVRGRSEEEMAERCRRWVEDEVLPRLVPAGLRRIERHRDEGHVVALLSTSPSYVVRPVAQALGLDHGEGTEFEVDGGRFTGALRGGLCYGSGKVHRAEALSLQHGLDLDRSWFYTDSYTDLPMLERVPHRVVINPDPRLRRAARLRGWPVESWTL